MNKLYVEKSGHGNNFDFLRFLLAVMVIFTHGYVIYYGSIDYEPLWRLSNHQLGFGTLALNFFFVISGFLVLKSLDHSKGGLDFLKKRILRIYPGFAVVCLLGALVFGPMGNGSPSNLFPNLIAYWRDVDFHQLLYSIAFLMPPELPETLKKLPCPNDINTSIWTIWYEFICYLVILVVGLLGLYRRKLIPLLLFLIVYGLNIWHYKNYQHYNEYGIIDWKISFLDEVNIDRLLNFEHFLFFFLAGSCFYYYRQYIPKNRLLIILSFAVMLVALRWVRVFELTQAVFGSYLLFCFAFSKTFRLYNFAKYGDFSYGVYLYGWPIQQLVFLYFGSKLNVTGTLIVSLLFVFPFAAFSWHVVEKQFLKLKDFSISSFVGKYFAGTEPVYNEKSGHDNNFYFLRVFMTMAVVFTHSYVVYSLIPTEPEPLADFSKGQLTVGSPALNFFFVMSGFLITQSWFYSKDWADFSVRRVLRVFPAYITVSLACVYIIGPLGIRAFPSMTEIIDYWSRTDLTKVLSAALTLAYPPTPETFTTVPAANIVNASLWSVFYEVLYYCIIILLGITGILKKKSYIFVLFLFVFVLNILHRTVFEAYNMGNDYDYSLIPYYPGPYFESLLEFEHYFNYFMAGVLFFTFRKDIPFSKTLIVLSIVIIAVSIRWLRIFEIVQPIFGTYLLLCFAYSKRIKLSGFARFGDFTYGMYLYGWPIQQLVLVYFGHRLSIVGTFFVAMAIIVPVSAISWYLIEKPFMELKNTAFKLNKVAVKVQKVDL